MFQWKRYGRKRVCKCVVVEHSSNKVILITAVHEHDAARAGEKLSNARKWKRERTTNNKASRLVMKRVHLPCARVHTHVRDVFNLFLLFFQQKRCWNCCAMIICFCRLKLDVKHFLRFILAFKQKITWPFGWVFLWSTKYHFTFLLCIYRYGMWCTWSTNEWLLWKCILISKRMTNDKTSKSNIVFVVIDFFSRLLNY